MNGTTYRKSRYLTLSAASNSPMPNDSTVASSAKSGNASSAIVGAT